MPRGCHGRLDIAGPAAGASPTGCSECGEMTESRSGVVGLRQRPPMNSSS
ncbi:putative betaine aldehyde dehydrogenase domain protein [Mycobacterium kansasii]|uniref:Putative betaine aldehyde dehydrogenase domain protein n=1 Tax=Mycobacterium kansasii TaxID=1768 RepID=A0A1V3XME5_MYCKA|nr:putative betaine aldehyde dehydrogenase domain protein [Mycobacterium kansasii]